jgi:hypothetical protein
MWKRAIRARILRVPRRLPLPRSFRSKYFYRPDSEALLTFLNGLELVIR